jgi:diguanylate cyclase (GGDEF)-like protein
MNIPLIEKDSFLILVVDDDKLTRMQLRRVMEREGYQVVEASDGEQCLAMFTHLHPDIILLDAMMPVMDGFACCAQLQTLSRSDSASVAWSVHTPVLMITDLEDQAFVDQAFKVGAADYVTKPIHWAVLRQRVHRLLQQAQLYRQLEHTNQVLQRLASLDGLTQIANRRFFDEYLEQEWRRMMREQGTLSIILFDIDFFKTYNDTYGHQAGDDCLQQIARAAVQAVKHSANLVARYGGEEFAVVLPNTELPEAFQVAENIRSAVKALAISHANSSVSQFVTLTLGIATSLLGEYSSPVELIAAADQDLYRAKAAGRDRVSIADDLKIRLNYWQNL